MPIRQLPETLQNRIAAGEVVERPAAVVKELVENALDAGAGRIEVEIEGGGRDLIRVTDDGSGMPVEDLVLSVDRHATSKLPTDDLMDIRTLGFRGEALPSIGAVAVLAITTRHASEPHAWELKVVGGEKHAPRPAALTRGTRVEVRDLFFATPARLKFLKSERAEVSAIQDVIERLSLSRPDVAISLKLGERAARALPGGLGETGERQRLSAILGPDAVADALPLEARREGLTLRGVVGRPAANRATAQDQYLFVNGRSVRDRLLLGALRAAYGDLLPRDRHPFAVLFLDIDPQEVDVNVHPAKAEVRFRNGGHVRALLISAVRAALSTDPTGAAETGQLGARIVELARPPSSAPSPRPGSFTGGGWSAGGFAEARQASFSAFAPPSARPVPVAPVAAALDEAVEHPLGAARAQLHATYIVAETAEGLVVVDQHAAHERIVYERLKRGLEANGVARQMLLIPEIVHLPDRDRAALLDHAEALEGHGLVVESFGPGAVVVREAPALLGDADLKGLVKDLAAEARGWDTATGLEQRLWAIASRMACHGSVRAGRALKPEEMNALLREMESTPNASTCNHGRPTYVKLGLAEMEKLFARR